MKKLRWTMDDGFGDLDMSTSITIDGIARPVPGDSLPLGLSRGTKLSRPKQIDFMQRFMSAFFLPSYADHPARVGDGLALQRVLTFPFGENWIATFLGQFNLQKLASSLKDKGSREPPESSWLKNLGKHLCDKSMYAFGFCSEFLITPNDTLLVSSEACGDKKRYRKKAVLDHKFPQHNLTVEATSPGLFVDKVGTYWDVPLLITADLASVPSDSGFNDHFCIHYISGAAKQFNSDQTGPIPPSLLPGLYVKSAFSIKKNVDIWRRKSGKLKMVQPFDIFLSDPHISASATVGTVATASFRDNSVRLKREDELQGYGRFDVNFPGKKCAFLADLFASVSCTAQHGNFQRLFLDLSQLHARLDFPSGSKFLSGAARLVQDLNNSQPPDLAALHAICPNVTLSLQQQIVGPFSFRIDSRVSFDFNSRGWHTHVDESMFAIEYALQVLGSAKAIAWYSTKHREAMVELRFFET